jgi:hypothetical protein
MTATMRRPRDFLDSVVLAGWIIGMCVGSFIRARPSIRLAVLALRVLASTGIGDRHPTPSSKDLEARWR